MNQNYSPIASIPLQGGIDASAPLYSDISQMSLNEQSWNQIASGTGYIRPYRGFTTQGANTGSRKMMHVGATWGGIKDNGGTQGAGNFFEDIGRSRWGIGAGFPHIEGTNVSGWTLSTNLQVSVRSSGVYAAPVQAGLAQPSAPEIGIVQSTGDVSNSVSAKIERTRPATGARSLSSPTSAVIVPQGNRVRVTFPAASSSQTHWRVYFTFQGFGGTGIHYLISYLGSTDIPEATVAAGTVDGVARSLEFNYKDGDLIPIEASYDDYTPPAATHAVRLGPVLNLVGCYADSAAAPTSTATGVAIAVSKINNYESYVPTHLLYLPEPVVDVQARPIDDYGYVACENSIHAIQYIGDRGDELPPCTLTTILPDVGIQYPHNWCHFRGQLLIYTAKGNLILMDQNGSFDTAFAAPVTKILKGFAPQSTVVGYDQENDSLIVANGQRFLTFSLQTGQWRQVWSGDFSVTGNVLSCTTVKRTLYVSFDNAGSRTAYAWDTGSATAPITIVSGYQNSPGGNAAVKDIFEMAVSGESSATPAVEANSALAVCLMKNGLRMGFRQVDLANGFPYAFVNDGTFENPGSAYDGKKALILVPNLEGAGGEVWQGFVFEASGTSELHLKNPDGSDLFPAANYSNVMLLVGDYVAVVNFDREFQSLANLFPNVPECRSYQVGFWFRGASDTGNIFTCDLFGNAYGSGRALNN